MSRTISNISTYNQSAVKDNVKVLSYTEELEKIAKIKHYLSYAYFVGVVVLMTTLFI